MSPAVKVWPNHRLTRVRDDGNGVLLVVDSFSARQQSFVCDDPDNKKSPTFQERVKDAFAAKRYLSTLGFVDPKRIGLVGWSHGAIAAVLAWAENASVSDAPPYAAVAAYYPYCMAGEISRPTVPLWREKGMIGARRVLASDSRKSPSLRGAKT